jgi:Fe-S cluster biogenesis protein NfuA
MFIQTEETPNPNALKFMPGREISPLEPMFFANKEEANISGLAVKLFDVDSVTAVFFGDNFITITKNETLEWSAIKPYVLMIIMDHFTAGFDVFRHNNEEKATEPHSKLSQIEREIVELLDSKVRPSVAMDGGDIMFVGFKDGIVQLKLRGACAGCPSSSITLKQGVESMLKHYIPEVIGIEEVLD